MDPADHRVRRDLPAGDRGRRLGRDQPLRRRRSDHPDRRRDRPGAHGHGPDLRPRARCRACTSTPRSRWPFRARACSSGPGCCPTGRPSSPAPSSPPGSSRSCSATYRGRELPDRQAGRRLAGARDGDCPDRHPRHRDPEHGHGLPEHRHNAALAVGSTVALLGLFASPISGASMNPARTLGPDIMSPDLTGGGSTSSAARSAPPSPYDHRLVRGLPDKAERGARRATRCRSSSDALMQLSGPGPSGARPARPPHRPPASPPGPRPPRRRCAA